MVSGKITLDNFVVRPDSIYTGEVHKQSVTKLDSSMVAESISSPK